MFWLCIILLGLMWPALRVFDRVLCYILTRKSANRSTYKCSFEGWLLFCPCYFPNDTLRCDAILESTF